MDNSYKVLLDKINSREIKIAVVGLGYVGLPLAIEFLKRRFPVTGIDTDKDRLQRIKRRESYITDISNQKLAKALDTKRFAYTADFRVLKEIDCVIICVPTPLTVKNQPDISFIKKAVRSISHNLKKGSLVILESTTYPGTTEEIILPFFEKNNLRHNRDFFLCFSPERIDPGNSNFPVNKIPKIVGGITSQARDLAAALYKNIIDTVVPVSSAKVAETVKLLENTFRLINIALINELAIMTHKMNIDIWEVIDAAKTKPFGFMPFYPGPGVGGHCIGKDPLYLYWKARKFGFRSRFIKLASQIISNMPGYVVERLEEILEAKGIKLKGSKILVIGVTYKKDVKDLRKSPSLNIIEILQNKNTRVSYFDPLIPYLNLGRINLRSIQLKAGELEKFACTVIATNHSGLDYDLILRHSKLIFDTRSVFKNSSDKKVILL